MFLRGLFQLYTNSFNSKQMISLCKVIILWSECQKAPTHLRLLVQTLCWKNYSSVQRSFSVPLFPFSSAVLSRHLFCAVESWSHVVTWPRSTRWLRSLSGRAHTRPCPMSRVIVAPCSVVNTGDPCVFVGTVCSSRECIGRQWARKYSMLAKICDRIYW